jgi:low affinity Fe/Cu permease
MLEAVQRALTWLGMLMARPIALLFVLAFGACWWIYQRETFNLGAVATLAVWVMTLLIQRTAHRDTQAIHAKLDELLRAVEAAHTELSKIDAEEPETIEMARSQTQKP